MLTTGFVVDAVFDAFRRRLPSIWSFPPVSHSVLSANCFEIDDLILDDHFRSKTFRSDRWSFPSAQPTKTRTTNYVDDADDDVGTD